MLTKTHSQMYEGPAAGGGRGLSSKLASWNEIGCTSSNGVCSPSCALYNQLLLLLLLLVLLVLLVLLLSLSSITTSSLISRTKGRRKDRKNFLASGVCE